MHLSEDLTDEIDVLKTALGSDTAIVSHIDGSTYEVLAVVSRISTLKPGDSFELGNTYCSQVVESRDTVAYNEVGTVEAMLLHPVYTAIQLEAYVGEPLYRDGDIVGTLNFSAFLPKRPGFTPDEIGQVKALARRVESVLAD